ncbi:hypothetical protein UR09_06635, partial [Candidatus Nitromaritima sp. SCGC AAA799-A02]
MKLSRRQNHNGKTAGFPGNPPLSTRRDSNKKKKKTALRGQGKQAGLFKNGTLRGRRFHAKGKGPEQGSGSALKIAPLQGTRL